MGLERERRLEEGEGKEAGGAKLARKRPERKPAFVQISWMIQTARPTGVIPGCSREKFCA